MKSVHNDRCWLASLGVRCLAAAGVACLALGGVGAGAQIGRSRSSAAHASSGGSGGRPSYGSRGGSYHAYTGRTPSSSGVRLSRPGSAAGPERGGLSSLDRYKRSQEGAAAREHSLHGTGSPYFPIGPYPFGYYPGGYFPGGDGPYGYPVPYPYPGPTYPAPGPDGRSSYAARYDSPYYYCDDLTGDLYVDGSVVIIAKPKRLYAPIPIYKNGELDGWRDLGAKDYLADRNAESTDFHAREQPAPDAALDAAMSDIRQSWTKGDVELLARHLNGKIEVAIDLQGRYLYSLEPGDLLEITRRAYGGATGLRFICDHLHSRSDGVYALTGRHLYTDKHGVERTVFFTYVLTKVKDDYIITEIATASDRE